MYLKLSGCFFYYFTCWAFLLGKEVFLWGKPERTCWVLDNPLGPDISGAFPRLRVLWAPLQHGFPLWLLPQWLVPTSAPHASYSEHEHRPSAWEDSELITRASRWRYPKIRSMEQFLEHSYRRPCLPLRLWMHLILSVSSLESRVYHSHLFSGPSCTPRQLWGGRLGLQCAVCPSEAIWTTAPHSPPLAWPIPLLYHLSQMFAFCNIREKYSQVARSKDGLLRHTRGSNPGSGIILSMSP